VLRKILYCLLFCGLCACGGSGARAPVEDRHAGSSHASHLYTVQPGDTLYAIAFRYRLDYRALAAANGLAQPYTIFPGQRMRLTEAPLPAPPVAPGGAAQVAMARPLPAVNRPQPLVRETAPPAQPVAVQGTAAPAGQSPPAAAPATSQGATAVTAPPAPAMAGEAAATAPPTVVSPTAGPQPAGPQPAGSQPDASRTATASVTKPSTSPAYNAGTPAASGRVAAWRWPTSGTVVRGYSSSVHKGIDIDGARGDAIYAVADGTVVYAGTGIVGLGRLLIVKHDEEYLSAYGHNERLHVAEGAVVRAGEKIAEKGSSGTDSVKLHFEVRRKGKPVDPRTLLPGR
jgi:lipoprotein NlpD